MQISERVHRLRHNFSIPIAEGKILPRFVNSFIVIGDFIVLIDSGVKDSHQKIFDYLKQIGKNPCDIKYLILSHAHPDHIGSAAEIKRQSGCTILAHPNEKRWFENLNEQINDRPVPGFLRLANESVRIDGLALHGDELFISENCMIEIIHTPGHYPGHLSMQIWGEDVLFTGDAIPLKNDLPNYHNYQNLIDSLELINKTKGYSTLVSSWADPMNCEKAEIFISEAREYLISINDTVAKQYLKPERNMEHCRAVINKLHLPPLFANPLSDIAFASHTF